MLAGPLVLLLLGVVLFPLPAMLLDLCLVANLVAAFLLVMLAASIEQKTRLSMLPTLLLVMTLGRLALNVASTRLILTQGSSFAGVLVLAFGSWVLQGSLGVGLVLFSILVAVQYLVVAKGSERVAEVAARFRLDALPMRQTMIEARRQDRSLTPDEADRELAELQQESDFYGALDGASKFVKGETMAGFLITGINLVGGIAIGLSRGEGSLGDVVRTYCLLTVGDGLVGWVPSMMVAVAAGLVTTKTSGQGSLSLRVVDEVLQSPVAVGVSLLGTGSMLLVFGAFSGVRPLTFLGLATLCFAGAGVFFWTHSQAEAAAQAEAPDAPVVLELSETTWRRLAQAFPQALAPNLEAAGHGLRDQLGIRIPVPELRPRSDLQAGRWRVLVDGLLAGEGDLDPERYLAVHSGEAPGERLPGDPDRDPLGHRPALLIAPEAAAKAQSLGYEVLSPPEVLGARLARVLLDRAADLFDHEAAKAWLAEGSRRFPALAREVSALGVTALREVLVGLLSEGVSLRSNARILEALAVKREHKGRALLEAVRAEIGRLVVEPLLGADRQLRCLVLAPALEAELRASFAPGDDGGEFLAIAPDLGGELTMAIRARSEGMARRGMVPVLLVSRRLRPHLRHFLRGRVADLRVLAYEEADGIGLRTEAVIDRFSRPGAAASVG